MRRVFRVSDDGTPAETLGRKFTVALIPTRCCLTFTNCIRAHVFPPCAVIGALASSAESPPGYIPPPPVLLVSSGAISS